MKQEFKQRLPVITVSLFLAASFFLTLKSFFNYWFIIIAQFSVGLTKFVLFGDPLSPSIIDLIITTVILIVTWLISTKISYFQSLQRRKIIFFNMVVGITFYYTWLLTAPIYRAVIPFLEQRIDSINMTNIWMEVMLGNTFNLMVILLFIPTFVVMLMFLWLSSHYNQHSKELKEAFSEFEFRNQFLQRFTSFEKKELWPDVILGPDSNTQELVIQPGRDRTLNNIIVGSIGTGKTAALVLPIINQDLHWMTRFINLFPEIHEREDYETEDVKGMYLNGISVIEPSNDLCQKVFKLVEAHKIPEQSVFYIDPTNPNTPSINPMQGPVEQVAEAFTMVIEGLSESGNSNFYFEQSQRNHLKHYIYLLKLHNPQQEVTFDMLLDMYDDSQLVHEHHLKLKETIPANIEQIEDRDEYNHWKIVVQIDKWFDTNVVPKKNFKGDIEMHTTGPYRGQPIYIDAKAEHVQGLRNILNDIGANKLIRRVLFGKSDFNFDKHLEYGGILLVNTAKGELAALSNVLGKLVLLSLQNAVFRRKPNVSNFHHIVVDEFPDYIYRPFKEFPAQSRKYKTIVTVVAQTVAQLADKYGETYMQTLLGTLRHKLVYGDISNYDAQLFSKIFGEDEKFEESTSEQTVSPLQENPGLRTGHSYQRRKEAILSPSDIIYQKEFQCAVKIVKHNRPMPVRQIDANFVPKEEFIEANIIVAEVSGDIWVSERNRNLRGNTDEFIITVLKDEQEDEPVVEDTIDDVTENQEQTEENEIVIPIDKPEFKFPSNFENTYQVKAPPGRIRRKEQKQDINEVKGVLTELPTDGVTRNIQTNVATLDITEKEEPLVISEDELQESEEDVLNGIFLNEHSNVLPYSQLDDKAEALFQNVLKEVNTSQNPATDTKRDRENRMQDLNEVDSLYTEVD